MYLLSFSDIRSCFPKLLVLDGKELPRPIGFEVDDVEVVMPPVRSSFFCDEGAKTIVLSFLDLYYKVFDSSDRSGLGAAYCEDAIFSFTSLLPENGPKAVSVDNDRMPNRNLKVLSATDDRVELLFRGRDAIMKQIGDKLPPSTHDVANMVVDMPLAKPQLVKVVVSGVYRREGLKQQSGCIRAFQRSLIIVPQGSGFCIANEQLYVTLATYEQIKEAFKCGGAGPSAAVPVAAAVVAPPATGGLEPQQLLMIEQFSTESKMKPEYSKMCLEQNAWDFQKAASLFVSLKAEGKIPPEYFQS